MDKKEKIKEYKRKYYLANKEKMNAYMKQYRLENKEKLNKKSMEYYHNHKDIFYKANKRWYQNNKSYYRAKDRLRKLWKNRYPLSNQEKSDIKTLYEYAQVLSRLFQLPFEVDHIKPLAKGGLHKFQNLQVVPMWFNRLKADRLDLSYFIKY